MDIPQKLGVKDSSFRLVIGSTQIDFDPRKEEVNRKKHGYSLESAAFLLNRWLLPTQPSPYIYKGPEEINGEIRYQHMGVDDAGKIVFMVTTMRPGETVRIISFRRANQDEREVFTSFTGYQD